MSSGEGDSVPAKDEDIIGPVSLDSSEKVNTSKMFSDDEVDHTLVIAKASSVQDEGLKSRKAFVEAISDSDLDNVNIPLDNSDEDIHLEWEDDETDEQDLVGSSDEKKKTDIAIDVDESISKASIPLTDKDSNKSLDSFDEQLLLDSPDGNENTESSALEINKEWETDKDNKSLDSVDEQLLLDSPDGKENIESSALEINKECEILRYLEAAPSSPAVKPVSVDKSDNLDEAGQNRKKLLSDSLSSKSENIVLDPNVSEGNNLKPISEDILSEVSDECDSKEISDNDVDFDDIVLAEPEIDNESILVETAVSTSSPTKYLHDTTIDIKLDHGLKKPDMMLDIPTQEIIEFIDDSDVSIACDETNSSLDKDVIHADAMDVENEETKIDSIEEDGIQLKTQGFKVNSKDTNSDMNKEPNKPAVSEDDWSEIERQLEGFETSLIKKSETDAAIMPANHELNKVEMNTKTNNYTEKPANMPSKDLLQTDIGESSANEPEPAIDQVKITDNLKSEKADLNQSISSTKRIDTELVSVVESSANIDENLTPEILEKKVCKTSTVERATEIEAVPSTPKENITEPTNHSESVSELDVQPSEILLKATTNQQLENLATDIEITLEKELNNVLLPTTESAKNLDLEDQSATSKMDIANPISPGKAQENTDKSELLESTVKTDIDLDDKPVESTKPLEIMEIDTEITEEAKSKLVEAASQIELQPSTSSITEVQLSTSYETSVQPGTSKENKELTTSVAEAAHLAPDITDEVPEMTDSLSLLAESSRVMEDDEEQEEEDDGDEYDDFDPEDESSNQMTAEHSEDSSAQHSETDAKEHTRKEADLESPKEEKGQNEFSFDIEEGVTEKDDATDQEKNNDVDVNEAVCEDEIDVTAEKIGETTITEDVFADSTLVAKEDKDTVPKQADTDTVMIETSEKKGESDDPDKSMLRKILSDGEDAPAIQAKHVSDPAKSSPSKKLEISHPGNVLNIVELEESSSEDDLKEVANDTSKPKKPAKETPSTVNTPESIIEKTVSAINKQEQSTSAVKELPEKATDVEKLSPTDKETEGTSQPKVGLEIFNLDSDDEDSNATTPKQKVVETTKSNKCLNISCISTGQNNYYKADASTINYYDAARRKKVLVCENCRDVVAKRTERLVDGIKEFTPLLKLDISKMSSELVEISDSESDDEAEVSDDAKETIGETGAAFLEAQLTKMINETWDKYKLDSRLTEAQDELNDEITKLEADSKEIDAMFNECQIVTDKLRNELYASFEQERHELSSLVIHDTPTNKYICLESSVIAADNSAEGRSKRRLSSVTEATVPAKRPAIALGYAPLDGDKKEQAQTSQEAKTASPTVDSSKLDDDKEISVLKVSAESAPPDLPPPGDLTRPPLRADMEVFASRNMFGSWLNGRIVEVQGKGQVQGMTQNFTLCRVKLFHSKHKHQTKLLPARCLAYSEPATVRMTIGTRVIAIFKDPMNPTRRPTFYSGIVAEVPNPVNNYRYLVFFDDGYAQYVAHKDTRIVCECSALVWEEVHPFSRDFVRKYLIAYPERPMVRLHAGQSLKTEWNGKWWASTVMQVDASLVQVHFEEDNRMEWIYRGSTRLAPLYLELQAAERHRARPMPRTKAQPRVNMPYVEYTRSDEQNKSEPLPPPPPPVTAQEREFRQRAVAKKSTAAPQPAPASADAVTSRVVYYTPKNAVKPYKMSTHSCGAHCKRKDVLALNDLRTYNPLAKPLLSGWERQIVRYKGHKEVMYRAPCGRRLRNMRELHRYLRMVQSDMAVDLFDFTPHTHCLAEFVLNKCLVGKKDLSHGKENVPVPCVNYYDESLPEFCSYNTERTPTAGVPLNLDPEFLCGCDCVDDCEDKSKCACWKMTLEGANTIGLSSDVGYVYKRLPEPLPSGIYECNSRCKCKQTCLNRVAQHPLQLKLQVFKTLNRGWGIRALNDVPKGSFLCVYAGNLLTDATANMDGLNEGDEYLAELDYIEVVEQMKEGYEEDIPEFDKKLDKKNIAKQSDESEEMSSSEEEEQPSKNEKEDGDFQPGFIGGGVSEFSKRLRKRDKKKKEQEDKEKKEKEKEGEKGDDDCITISDDEEVREPSRFTAQAGMESSGFVSKYKSVRALFGRDEACYIMDAKVQGNIGRYLNHSCTPNVFVQNVFVDTHDPRFPWVAFFALAHIKAGTELTWNYNYDVGSVPGKALYCYCGAPNCRGRLL